jgi:N-acetylmuramoyl-L-alanine amidase
MSTRSRSGEDEPKGAVVMRPLGITLVVAAILATIFTAWTPTSLQPDELAGQLAAILEQNSAGEESPLATTASQDENVIRIGIVAGHSGLHPDTGYEDPGATCPDGLTEVEINQSVADLVVQALEAGGLEVDLLEEWDERLFGYRAAALVSIHTDSCIPINDEATGYKVTTALDTVVPDKSQRLASCLVDRYGRATDLKYHPGSITADMTEYHSFREIHHQTPAAVIELGFMYLDRGFLTQHPEKAARGIAEGVLCYINNEPVDLPWQGAP